MNNRRKGKPGKCEANRERDIAVFLPHIAVFERFMGQLSVNELYTNEPLAHLISNHIITF